MPTHKDHQRSGLLFRGPHLACLLLLGISCLARPLAAQLHLYLWDPVERADYFLLTITQHGKSHRAMTRNHYIYLPAGAQLAIKVLDTRGRLIGWPLALITPLPEGHMANDALMASEPPRQHPSKLEPALVPPPPSESPAAAPQEARQEAVDLANGEARATAWEAPYHWSFSSAGGLGSESITAQGGASSFQANNTRIAVGQFDLLAARQQQDLSLGSLLGLRARLHLHIFLILQASPQALPPESQGQDISIDRTFVYTQCQHLIAGDYQTSVYAAYGLAYLATPFMRISNPSNGDATPVGKSTAGLALSAGVRSFDGADFDGIAEATLIPWTGNGVWVNKWSIDLEGRYYVLPHYYGSMSYSHSSEKASGTVSCAPNAVLCDSQVQASSDSRLLMLGLGLSF